MKKHISKRLLSLVIALALCLALAVPGFAVTEANGLIIEKVDSSAVSADLFNPNKVEETAQQTHNYAASDIVRVSIVLDGKSTFEKSRDSGTSMKNYASTSSLVNYRARLLQTQQTLASRISRDVLQGAELDVVWNLTLAANIISANIKFGQIDAIKKVAGVKDVILEAQYAAPDAVGSVDKPNMSTSTEQIGSTNAWLSGYTGAGSRIAIIDTGTDTDHQSFSNAAYLYALEQNAKAAGMSYDEYVASLNLLDVAEITEVFEELNIATYKNVTPEKLYVNEKLPFGYNYVDENFTLTHDKDQQGEHGSHVAGIATANRFIPKDGGFVDALTSVYVQGVAPDAQLITMKVFGASGGAYDSDYMAAIEDAIVLGCDSVNLSLGSARPGFTFSPSYQHIMDSLTEADTVVVMSAGNNGFWSQYDLTSVQTQYTYPHLLYWDTNFHTAGSPGTFTNSMAVASVDNAGFTNLFMEVGGVKFVYNEVDTSKFKNNPFTTIAGEQEYVFLNGIGTDAQFESIKDVVKGKVAVCYRGETSFFEKANAAVAAGAIGVIIVNNQPGVINMDMTGYNYKAPACSLLQSQGEYFKNGALHTSEDGSVLYWVGEMLISDFVGTGSHLADYYTMSEFSSWGVPGDLSMKPEITAPGGEIYSVFGSIPSMGGYPANNATDKYELMSGTSMAAPQVTGMMAVLMQYIRENNLSVDGLTDRALANSLLMSTAVPMYDANGNYYPVLQQGSGLANIGNAVMADSYILMGADANDSWKDGKVKVELGDDPDKTGSYSFSFSVNNLTDKAQNYILNADFFTQDLYQYSGLIFTDTATTLLNANVTWTVAGQTKELDLNLDFDGNGHVNEDDGQAILDYVSGARSDLYNLASADVDGDGDVDTHDAYTFLDSLFTTSIAVPANGSVDVTVNVQMNDSWLRNYPSGAYIEGYVYVDAISTEEGVEGVSHSIPVLGFYGNWSTASMYDDYNFYVYSGSPNAPVEISSNFLTTYYSGLSDEYYFGGNPMFEETYKPERDAFSAAAGSQLANIYFTSIRAASDSFILVSDHNTGEIYQIIDGSQYAPASFNLNSANPQWNDTVQKFPLRWRGSDIPNNTVVDFSLVLIPEYYADATGKCDLMSILPELDSGVFQTYTFTMDNEAPEVDPQSLVIDEEAGTMTFSVTDNQYVAGAVLLDSSGETVLATAGSFADAKAGDTLEYALDVSEVNGMSFLLLVSDYADNTTFYIISQQIGDVTDAVDSVTLSHDTLTMAAGRTAQLTATVAPTNTVNKEVKWTSSDETVATVDQNGKVTTVGAGTATITATSTYDATKFDTCAVNVVTFDYTVEGLLLDGDVKTHTFGWDIGKDKTWTPGASVDLELAAAAGTGSKYAFVLTSASNKICLVDTTTGQVLTEGASLQAPFSDLSYSMLTDAAQNDYLNVIAGAWILLGQNPNSPSYSGLNLGSYLSTYTGASAFVAIDTLGVYMIDGQPAEVIIAMDDAGYLSTILYFFQTGNASVSSEYSGVPANFSLEYDYVYSSMVTANDGNIFLSQFDGDKSVLYLITYDEAAEAYQAIEVGDFGTNVWPASLTAATLNTATEENAIENILAATNWIEMDEPLAITTYPVEPAPEADGALNTVGANSVIPAISNIRNRIDSYDMRVNGDKMELDVVAKDDNGKRVSSTNGLIVVDFDPAAQVFDNINVYAQYYSVMLDEVNGTVTIAYADLDGIPGGRPVATISFQSLANGEHVAAAHLQYNNVDTSYTEASGHVFTDWYVVTLPSNGHSGVDNRHCVMCGLTEYRFPGTPGGSTSTPSIPVDGHTCTLNRFSDLDTNAWYHGAVDFVVSQGIMNGTGNGTTFSPYMNLSRAMMMTMLARLDGVNTSIGSTWYEIGMKWAVENGISDGTNPNADITREQLITMLYRYAGSPAVSANNYLAIYADGGKVSSWAKDAMNWAISMGIIQGNGSGLNPQGLATRVEVAQIICNYLTR